MAMGPYKVRFCSLPRGSGIDRTLGCSDLVLIDFLHGGYVKDVTRVRTAYFTYFFVLFPLPDVTGSIVPPHHRLLTHRLSTGSMG